MTEVSIGEKVTRETFYPASERAGIPPIGPSMRKGPQSGGSFPINVVKKVGLDEKWDREDENLARS